ncbi:TIGR03085 family metal-binding protein [Rhodococcus aerolatus]
MTTARDERAQLSDLLDEVGPDAPTLCGEWDARQLAAHLVLRERRLDAAPGILLGPLSGYTGKVQRGIAAQDWRTLVGQVRGGPPVWSPFKVLDRFASSHEFLVHHEDVRRARPGWEPRALPASTQDEAWRLVKGVARLGYRASPVGVALRRAGSGATMTPRSGPRTVTLVGEPVELLLHAFGRDAVRVDMQGDDADVAAVAGLQRGF